MKDEVFLSKKKITPFEFNEEVASVFDDMVSRSVPFYDEIHKLILDLAGKMKKKKMTIYDLGCSTGSTIVLLDRFFQRKNIEAHFIGVDNSMPMLEKAHQKLVTEKVRSFNLICDDLRTIALQKSDFIIMNYTLQFIPVKDRLALLKKIKGSLKKNSYFLMSEKICADKKRTQELITELYYDFKERNGYSRLEISRKREALEKVLIPLCTNEEIELLKKSGFKEVEQIFRWYNFSSFLGINP